MTVAERSMHSTRRAQDALRHLSRAIEALDGAPTGRFDRVRDELVVTQARLLTQWGRERKGHAG